MNYLNDIYQKTLAENEKNIRFWEDYSQNLQSLDFGVFTEKLKVPALVPVGSRMLFRGELIHTNEIITSLGADYFAKCSVKQAEVLRQHRIKDAQSKLEAYKKEREYIEKRLSFTEDNIFQDNGQEIIEVLTEEEDKAWRQKHRENIRRNKQQEDKNTSEDSEITDEYLWMRLEELELQEEFEEQLNSQEKEEMERRDSVKDATKSVKSKVIERSESDRNKVTEKLESVTESFMALEYQYPKKTEKKVKFETEAEPLFDPGSDQKLYLLKKIWEKQNQLEGKLLKLKNKDRRQTRSEGDLYSRLDEMEELEDLEDEMDRLDAIIGDEGIESGSDDSTNRTHIIQRSVSFSDENKSETLELTFSHSSTTPCMKSYDSEQGIQKPSDIYDAHSNLFNETTSILKRPKYSSIPGEKKIRKVSFQVDDEENVGGGEASINRMIVVNDVAEKVDRKKVEVTSARPTSLFKKRRQEMKS